MDSGGSCQPCLPSRLPLPLAQPTLRLKYPDDCYLTSYLLHIIPPYGLYKIVTELKEVKRLEDMVSSMPMYEFISS